MNLLLLYEEDRVRDDRFRIAGRRAVHLRNVLNVSEGDDLRVGLLEGPLGRGTVLAVGEAIEITCIFEEKPPRPPLDLVLAVPRPKSLKKLLPEVVALGVDRLVLLRTWRVAKPYLSTAILARGEYVSLVREGMMQGVTTRAPTVTVEPLFKPFVEDRLPAFAKGRKKLVAHPYAARPLASHRIEPEARVTLLIGPEGGLIPYEIETLQAIGFEPVKLGDRILRVETACVAALAQIDLLRQQAGAGGEPSRKS